MGFNPEYFEDQLLPQAPPLKMGATEAHDPIYVDQFGGEISPDCTLTKSKLIAKLSASLVEVCYDAIKSDFENKMVMNNPIG